jgi:hypothetical protein
LLEQAAKPKANSAARTNDNGVRRILNHAL